MDKANQVRLNHELLIWRGFTLSNGVWSYPDGVTVDNGIPYFPESLDEIFKWLVPWVVADDSYTVEIRTCKPQTWVHLIAHYYMDKSHSAQDKDAALALCLAIQKLIRSK